VKAVAKTQPAAGVEIIDVEEPSIRPGCVKLRLERASVCGTDLHIYQWDPWAAGRIKPPRIIGHEFCGTITEVGEGVTDRKVGDFVSSESHIVALDDPDYIRGDGHIAKSTQILGVDVDGGFAEFAVIPAMNARLTDASVPRGVASMQDALGNAVHTAMDGPIEGQTILISGLGPIGLFAGAICKCLGAKKVYGTEVSPYRIELGEQIGIDRVINPTKEDPMEVLGREEPGGVDGVLEMSGHPSSLKLAIEATRPGGRISQLGVFKENHQAIDMNQLIFKGLRFQGIVGRRLWETWDQMHWLLTEKGLDVTPIVTHEMPFTEIEKAFGILEQGEAGKIVLTF
jgi:threonine 3-dehydrogenase